MCNDHVIDFSPNVIFLAVVQFTKHNQCRQSELGNGMSVEWYTCASEGHFYLCMFKILPAYILAFMSCAHLQEKIA